MIQGKASKMAAIPSTFSGTMKGENTPTAISLASGGMCILIGCAMKFISPSGPGQKANKARATSTPPML